MNKVYLTGRLTPQRQAGIYWRNAQNQNLGQKDSRKNRKVIKTLVNPSSKQLVDAGLASKETIIVLSEPNR